VYAAVSALPGDPDVEALEDLKEIADRLLQRA
jgi:hypothetical protein